MPGTILIGVDVESASEASAGYARYGAEMLAAEEVPATWYVTGSSLERDPNPFAEVDRAGIVDIQSHTYHHILLKTVCIQVPPGRTIHGRSDWYVARGGTNGEIDQDLDRYQKLFQDVFGRKAVGLTCPWNYYRGLLDRPDLLEIVYRHGFRFMRSFGRNETDGQPTPIEWQPFFYTLHGYDDLLELFIHDYQDAFYFVQFNGLSDAATYSQHLQKMANRVASEDLVWSLCTHDHGCSTKEAFQERQTWLRDIIRYAGSLGIRFLTGSQYYASRLNGQKI